jgi:hypothetical protein
MSKTEGFLSAAAGLAVTLALAGGALAQTGPAERPPASFDALEYVDTGGCVFVRVEVDGRVDWVPRVAQDRQPVCGRTPSLAQPAPVQAAEAPALRPAPAPAAPAPARTIVLAEAAPPRTVQVIIPPALMREDGTARVSCAHVRVPGAYVVAADGSCIPVEIAPVPPAAVAQPTASGQQAVRALAADNPGPPPGWRTAWDDGRTNPHRGIRTVEGDAQMHRVWTDTVPRRLVGD